MNKDIYPIYHNKFGIAFQWKRDVGRTNFNKIQLVFRDTGLYLTAKEIQEFYQNISDSKSCKDCDCCKSVDKTSRYILLKTPSSKVDIAVSVNELLQIEDLVKGTLFQIHLDEYINQLCKN